MPTKRSINLVDCQRMTHWAGMSGEGKNLGEVRGGPPDSFFEYEWQYGSFIDLNIRANYSFVDARRPFEMKSWRFGAPS
jgi:hypothetical protein